MMPSFSIALAMPGTKIMPLALLASPTVRVPPLATVTELLLLPVTAVPLGTVMVPPLATVTSPALDVVSGVVVAVLTVVAASAGEATKAKGRSAGVSAVVRLKRVISGMAFSRKGSGPRGH